MQAVKRRIASPTTDLPSDDSSSDPLENELDKLALQIVRRATRQANDGLNVEPLQMQLNALKIAGAYYALKKKNAAPDEAEGSGWGNLLLNSKPGGLSFGDEETDDDAEDDDETDEEEAVEDRVNHA